MSDLTLFSKVEADRILKRAAEIEGSDEAGPVTVEELRSIAAEAGFGAQAIDRAIAEARQTASASGSQHRVEKSGLVVRRYSTGKSVPVDIGSEQLMRAVRLFQPYRDGPAHINPLANGMMWRDRKGLTFTVISSGGVTEIRVAVAKFAIRRRRLMTWVQAAADRLEALVLLMATRDTPLERRPRLPATARTPAGPSR